VQFSKAATAHARVGIGHGRDHAAHAGGDDPLRARTRPPGVATRFERDEEGTAARAFTCFVERIHFGVRFPRTFMPSMSDNDAVGGQNDGANHRVGRCPSLTACGVKERTPHEIFIALP
jgi:hypothetical protein